MSDLIPLFGSDDRVTPTGHTVSGGAARRSQREIEQAAARVEVEAVREHGRAFLTSLALTNTATLVSQAEAHLQQSPSGGQFYQAIIAAYANGAVRRIQNL